MDTTRLSASDILNSDVQRSSTSRNVARTSRRPLRYEIYPYLSVTTQVSHLQSSTRSYRLARLNTFVMGMNIGTRKGRSVILLAQPWQGSHHWTQLESRETQRAEEVAIASRRQESRARSCVQVGQLSSAGQGGTSQLPSRRPSERGRFTAWSVDFLKLCRRPLHRFSAHSGLVHVASALPTRSKSVQVIQRPVWPIEGMNAFDLVLRGAMLEGLRRVWGASQAIPFVHIFTDCREGEEGIVQDIR